MSRFLPAVCNVLLLLVFGASSAIAQPVNDDCANAIAVICGDFITADTTSATAESLPFCGTTDGSGGVLWYEFVGTGDEIELSTCNNGTTFDTKLRVYAGTCGALTCVTGIDDSCGTVSSRVNFVSTNGVSYYIALHGFGANVGVAELSIACFAPPAPAINDDCVNAIAVADGSYTGDTRSNNTDGDSSCASASGAPSIWYVYSATSDLQLRVSLCNATYDNAVSIWSDCPNNSPVELGCNDNGCSGQGATLTIAISAGNDYYIRVAGSGAASGTFTMTVLTIDPSLLIGPDVTYSDCTSISQYGPIGGTYAYSLGSNTCNIGDEDLAWGGDNPLLAMNSYRLVDGRIEQIGMSFVKNGTGAAASSGCGVCNGHGGSVLGAGCLDVYGSGFNGIQSILGPRSQVNGFTGAYPGASGPNGTIDKRMQVQQADMDIPGSRFLVEGVYVAWDDALAGNAYNNASYKLVNINGSYQMSPTGQMNMGRAAIYAWADHGLGTNQPDPSVNIQEVSVPAEGIFIIGSKVEDLGGGSWRYSYAIFNLNSHQSADGWSIPTDANISNVGFHDVDYHSGEPYDNSDWVSAISSSSMAWNSPSTFAQDPNTNALRWGTMYTYWFDADQAPEPGTASLSLFRPGANSELSITVLVPGTIVVNPGTQLDRGDCNVDGSFDLSDAVTILAFLFPTIPAALDCDDACDANDDESLNVADAVAMLDRLFGSGAPLPSPHGVCGIDNGGPLDCLSNSACNTP